MSAEVSVRTLNHETSKVLGRVKLGEEVVVTERGEVIARIVPASRRPLDRLISEGVVRPAAATGPAPRPSVPMGAGPEAGALLESMRGEERY